MNILYFSALSSKRLINMIKEKTDRDPGYAVQKFNRLIVRGLIENNANIKVLSSPPLDRRSYSGLSYNCSEIEDEITYKYIPFLNLKGLKQLCIFLYSFVITLKQGIFHKRNSAIVCDALAISACIGAVWAARISGIKTIGVLTDMPGLMVTTSSSKNSFLKKIKHNIVTAANKSFLHHFTHYVFLTEQMNTVININNRPYIIMEGLCDSNISDLPILKKNEIQTIMYAGGLYEKYGLKKLTDAFMLLPNPDIRFLIYGAGPYAEELKKIADIDNRIIYKGLEPNDIVIAAEMQSTLLVNPRPTTEEFTKYSFPSKNIEYMASGTPLLTTKLPGIPAEYSDYVFFIEDESVEGYANALNRVLSKGDTYLADFGDKAKQWVLKHKNYKYQASRIISLLKI